MIQAIANSVRRCSLTIVVLTVLIAVPGVGYSQSPWPAIQLGRINQGSPLTAESGWTAGVHLPVSLHRAITVRPGLDFVRSHVNSSISVCSHIPGSEECLHRPETESVLYAGITLRAVIRPNARVRPFLEGGGTVGRSLSEENPGERRTFLTPHIGLGVSIPSRMGTWSLGGWWRRLDRWPEGLDKSSVSALVVAFQPGNRR